MQLSQAQDTARPLLHNGVSNRQRLARYDHLIDLAQRRADEAICLAVRRRYLVLILHLEKRALRELDRGR
jgi:hypothetical protein